MNDVYRPLEVESIFYTFGQENHMVLADILACSLSGRKLASTPESFVENNVKALKLFPSLGSYHEGWRS